jgi:hypothetical protein
MLQHCLPRCVGNGFRDRKILGGDRGRLTGFGPRHFDVS